MLRELLSIFRADNPLAAIGKNFTKMLALAVENILAAGAMYFENRSTPEERSQIYEKDVEINKLERTIRKQVVTHLSLKTTNLDVPYCMLMMSLVKDVERLGDYAKNLSELVELQEECPPEDELGQELREIRREVEEIVKAAADVLNASDRERAMEFIMAGKDVAHRCETLVSNIAYSQHPANVTVALALAARHYKRISGHARNILTSVVMPLHKVDYFDEDDVSVEDGGKA